jgi:hypothetical protein
MDRLKRPCGLCGKLCTGKVCLDCFKKGRRSSLSRRKANSRSHKKKMRINDIF